MHEEGKKILFAPAISDRNWKEEFSQDRKMYEKEGQSKSGIYDS
jgi:hypothetical protein